MVKHTVEEAINDIPRFAQYIDIDKDLVIKLNKNKDDTDELRELLKSKAKEDFIVTMLEHTGPSPTSSDVFVEKLSRHIIEESGMMDELMAEDLGLKYQRPKEEKRKEEKLTYKPWERKVTAHTSTGKEYKRGRKDWTEREEKFVESREGIKSKDLATDFRDYFGYERSSSSLVTKRRRLTQKKRIKSGNDDLPG